MAIQGTKLPKNKCYLGNRKIKKDGVEMRFTTEMINEYNKCKNDIVYFCKEYIKIVHVDDGLIDFNMYDFQEDFINNINDNRFSIALCSRQVGKCASYKTMINIRNKTTGLIEKISIGEFYDLQKAKK